MHDLDVLESVLAKDQTIIDSIQPDQLHSPTPCPDFDVARLVNHIISGLQRFAAGVNGSSFTGDPDSFIGDSPSRDYRNAADGLLAGWNQCGMDRTVHLGNADLSGKIVMARALTEYLTHGCDLAIALGREVPFSDEEITVVFERASATLGEEYRGEGKPFGPIIDVPWSAPVLDRFLGFMGRKPLTSRSGD